MLRIILSTTEIFRRCIFTNPALIVIVQAPLFASELVQEILGVNEAIQPSPVVILTILPTYFVLSFFASAMTFIAAAEIVQSGSCSLGHVRDRLRGRSLQLIAASLTVGCLSGLGLIALIVPGLILMTAFLFVPHLLMSDESISISVAVTRSKKLAFRFKILSFVVVLTSFGLSTLLYLVGEQFGTYFGAAGSDIFTKRSVLFFVRAGLAVMGGGLIDVWVAAYFIALRKLQ